jgi:hypothetical protein
VVRQGSVTHRQQEAAGREQAHGEGRQSMKQSIWWHLSMKYHRDPVPGHTYTNTSKECYECKQIKALFDKVTEQE